jgi:hypothetical protein
VSGGLVTKIIAGANITVSGDGTGEVTISSTGGGGGGGSINTVTATGPNITATTVGDAVTITSTVIPQIAGTSSMAIGTNAPAPGSSTGGNTFVGANAGVDHGGTNGNSTYIGSGSGRYVVGGNQNTFVGAQPANYPLTSASQSTLIGYNVGASIGASTSFQTMVGTHQGYAGTSGEVIIGRNSNFLRLNTNGALCIATNVATEDFGTTGQVLTSNGSTAAPTWTTIPSASISQAGLVQLVDSTSSNSTTAALTANQGKILQTQIDSLLTASNLTFAGTFNAATSQIVNVTQDGTTAGFVVGDNLPAAGPANTNSFVIVVDGGSYSPPGGGGPYNTSQGDWYLSTGTAWDWLNVGYDPPISSTVTQGIVQLEDSVTSTSTVLAGTANSVKTAYDAATAAQADATQALSDAASAQADATQALSDAAAAQVIAENASDLATNAEAVSSSALTDATQALTTAGDAEAIANSAQTAANAAQADADAAQTTANSALTTANAAIPKSIFTSKGNLLVGTGSGTYTRIGVGTNGYSLTADSSVGAGVVWRQKLPVQSLKRNVNQTVSVGNWYFRYNDVAKALMVMSTTADNACWTVSTFTRSVLYSDGEQRAFTANTWYIMTDKKVQNQGESQVAYFIALDAAESFRITLIKGTPDGNNNTITLEELT